MSWKLSRTVLRGGAASNGGSLLDKKIATGKQPYALALADRGIMALAGVWENWQSPAGEWVRSFAIVTTTPNQLCAEIHNRMPVILEARGMAGMARRAAGGRAGSEGPAGPLPCRGMIAGRSAPASATSRTTIQPDRADLSPVRDFSPRAGSRPSYCASPRRLRSRETLFSDRPLGRHPITAGVNDHVWRSNSSREPPAVLDQLGRISA